MDKIDRAINPVLTLREFILTVYENYIINDSKDARRTEVYPIMDKGDVPDKSIFSIANYMNRDTLYEEIVKEMNKYYNRYSELISKYLNRDINFKTIKITPSYGQQVDRTLLLIDEKGLPVYVDNMYRIALFLDTALHKKAITTTIVDFNKNVKRYTKYITDYCKENNIYVDTSILKRINNEPSICYRGVINHRLTIFNY